ncbi:MAG: hypothetical protein KC415_05515 [Anaerolineales bacterium]|nr:hypothetical protein [Anaerolineales bacterium]
MTEEDTLSFYVTKDVVQALAQKEQAFYDIRGAFSGVTSGYSSQLERYHEEIVSTGQFIYESVFGHIGDVHWKNALKNSSRFNLNIDPALWHFSWELLFDKEVGSFLDRSSRPIVRYVGEQSSSLDTLCLETPQMLFMGTDPFDRPTRESEQFDAITRSAPAQYKKIPGFTNLLTKVSSNFSPSDSQWDIFVNDLWEVKPNILHIVAHGSGANSLIFNDLNNSVGEQITYHGFVNILEEIGCVQLLVLTVCKSNYFFLEYPQLAQLLFEKTNLSAIVLMASEIGASSVTKFTYYFYYALWRGRSVASAIGYARDQMRTQISRNFSLLWSTPMLYERIDINPFGNWLEEMCYKYLNAPTIQDEHIETLHEVVVSLQDKVNDLVLIHEQAYPFQDELLFHCEEVEKAISRLSNAMTLTNQSYDPQNSKWLNSVRATRSQTIPILQRLVAFSRSPKRKHQLPQVIREAQSACQELLNHFSLENLPKSTI